jgi:3-deoxy-D-manno-octulosonic-acid transferase
VIIESLTSDVELIVTIFSSSAERSLLKLIEEVESINSSSLIWAGFSPMEGEWLSTLRKLKPDIWVTLRYEAWPDLWASLARLQIPTVIIGATDRSSLRWARRICKFLCLGKLPSLHLLTVSESDRKNLEQFFGLTVPILSVGDPRWDQMHRRSLRRSPRVNMLLKAFEKKPRPWGVIGSAWRSDLEFLGESVFKLPGTLWLVPHEVDGKAYDDIERFLRRKMISFEKTKNRFFSLASSPDKPSAKVILVNETGILAELYEKADWAYVGGGFERGVHSTLEPAFFGLPIAIGPKRADTFPEVAELMNQGQIQILEDASKRTKWLDFIRQNQFLNSRKLWLDQVQARTGATRRVLNYLKQIQ